MQGKFNFKLWALGAILSAMLVVPALGQVKEDEGNPFRDQKEQMIKELQLSPDKAKVILAVEDKYAKGRKQIMADMKKAIDDLQAALASANPDRAKVKKLVRAVIAGQDKMFISYKNQRDKELSLLTPVEEGKYIMRLANRQKMTEKPNEPKAGEKQ
jgi:Spy/CpxP family protein refolding chaperone